MELIVTKKSNEQYWLSKFSGELMSYELPWESENSNKRRKTSVVVPKAITSEVLGICKGDELAIKVLLSTVIALCLRKYSNQNQLILCIEAKGQRVPLRIDLVDKETFGDLLDKIKRDISESLRHLDYSYDEFVKKLILRGDGSVDTQLDKVMIADITSDKYDQYAFYVQINREEDNLELVLNINTSEELLPLVENFGQSLLTVLGSIKDLLQKEINQINILTPNQRVVLVDDLNPIPSDCKSETILELFDNCVKHFPDQRVLIHGMEQITYRMLDHISGRIAAEILKGGAKEEEIVAVMLDRSIDLVASFIGALKVGGAFLPIDPEYPLERIKYILKDSTAHTVITSKKYTSKLGKEIRPLYMEDLKLHGEVYSNPLVQENNLAYIIYTSGTTGLPNGVMIEHRSLVNLCHWHNRYYQTSEDDITSKYAGQGFDATVWEVFPPLVCGGTLYIVDDEHRHSIYDLNSDFIRNGVTISFLPTQLGEQFMHLDNLVLKKLLLGGDKLRSFNKKVSYEVYNNYGPSENTVVSTAGRVTSQLANIPIGKPIDNTRLYILEPNYDMLQPLGVAGELCIAGESLARGYWNNDELTLKRFIENPFKFGEKLYRTGDMAKWLPNGEIEFLGRIDDQQVKIRGYRVELGEIESALLENQLIADVVVVKKEESENKNYLCAYYVSDEYVKSEDLISFLSKKIPSFMIPSLFVQLETIPTTANGKVDREQLRTRNDIHKLHNSIYKDPKSEIEKIVQQIWQDVLNVSKIGIEDNFFNLGGDSIMAIQIESRLINKGYSTKGINIFDYPTIQGISRHVSQMKQSSFQGIITGSVPLIPIQATFFNSSRIIDKSYFNQALLLDINEYISEDDVKIIFSKLQTHHDALRMTFKEVNGKLNQQNNSEIYPVDLTLYTIVDFNDQDEFIRNKCNEAQMSIDIENGPLMKLVLFQSQLSSKIAIIIHHLVIDGVSWRILLEDIDILFRQVIKSADVALPLKTDSFKLYAEKLIDYANQPELRNELPYWKEIEETSINNIFQTVENNEVDTISLIDLTFTEEETQHLIIGANHAYSTNINQLLISSLSIAINEVFDISSFLVWLEGHGREKLLKNVDVSRTVGWFTSVFPFLVEVKELDNIENLIIGIKDNLNRVPNKGIGYGISKLISQNKQNSISAKSKEIIFNYLGQFEHDVKNKLFTVSNDLVGNTSSYKNSNEGGLEIIGLIVEGCLKLSIQYNSKQIEEQLVVNFTKAFKKAILSILQHCNTIKDTIITPSDFSYKYLPQQTISQLVQKYSISDIYPLSQAQEGMLFHSLLDQQSANYYEQVSYDVSGDFELIKLKQVLELLYERHDILRTKFYHDDHKRPVQIVMNILEPELEYLDLSRKNTHDLHADIEVYKEHNRIKGFDLTKDTLIRLCVARLPSNKSRFIWTFHHILLDGWSAVLLSTEFHTIYNEFSKGNKPKLLEAKPFKNHIKWLETRNHDESKSYWSEYLKDFSNSTPMSSTYAKEEDKHKLADEIIIIDEQLTKRLQDISSENQVTLSTLMQCVWSIIVGRYNNAKDVVFGKVVSGRPSEVEGIENMIGLFINTNPVRIKFDHNDSFADLVKQVQSDAIQNEPHHYYSLSEIQKNTEIRDNLFDHIFVFENYPINTDKASQGAIWQNVDAFWQTNYNLNVIVVPGTELKITLRFKDGGFEPHYIPSLRNSLLSVLEQIVNNISIQLKDIFLVSKVEENKILNEFNISNSYTSQESFLELFAKQIEQNPDKIAVIYNDRQLTYFELNERSNFVCRELIRRGLIKGDVAGILFDKSENMIIGLLGILKAQGVFLPIDPEYPHDRINYMLTNSEAKYLLTENKFTNILKGQFDTINIESIKTSTDIDQPNVKIELDTPAYIIFTSGTTGLPNGAVINHQALANLCVWYNKFFALSLCDISSKYVSFGFDITVFEIFPALISGGALYITEEKSKYDLPYLNQCLVKYGVTICNLPTPLGEQFMKVENNTLRKLLIAGDKLKYINEKVNYEIYNVYGPTENTVLSTVARIERNEKNIPIGKPIDITKIYIMSTETTQLQPIGVIGELCTSGDSVAKGYVGKPEITKRKFGDDPFYTGKKMYRTGDLARWLPNGNIEFIGRIDHQVKVRGYRIELGEIENALLKHNMIAESAVLVKENNNRHKVLYAFYSALEPLNTEELRSVLLKSLPHYMIPQIFIQIEQFPVNKSGKIDRKELGKMCENYERPTLLLVPENKIERDIAQVWSEVLGVTNISVEDNFFDLGGTSLDMMQVLGKLSKIFPVDNLLMQMFTYPTIKMLAAHLDNLNQNVQEEIVYNDTNGINNDEIKLNRLRQREKRRIGRD